MSFKIQITTLQKSKEGISNLTITATLPSLNTMPSHSARDPLIG